MPIETLALLRDLELPTEFIHGNGDREVLAQMAGTETAWYRNASEQWRAPVRWTAQELRPEHQTLIAAWPSTRRKEIQGLGEVLFCHATPRNDTECFTRTTPESRLRPVFDNVDTPVVVCGHTHMQFDRTIGKVRVVNAGSVGMPFGGPGAYWLLLGPDIELRHTAYDLEKAAARIRKTPYPQAEELAASVQQPAAEEEMLAVFAKAELC